MCKFQSTRSATWPARCTRRSWKSHRLIHHDAHLQPDQRGADTAATTTTDTVTTLYSADSEELGRLGVGVTSEETVTLRMALLDSSWKGFHGRFEQEHILSHQELAVDAPQAVRPQADGSDRSLIICVLIYVHVFTLRSGRPVTLRQ